MSSIINYFFSPKPQEKEIEDPVSMYMPETMIEEMACFTLSNCTLYTLKPKAGKQYKHCEFINCSLNLNQHQMELETKKQNIPVIRIINDDYDEDQDQKAEEVLPVSDELTFFKYSDGADHMDEECKNEVCGFVFFYP